jgi:hypothetical protein
MSRHREIVKADVDAFLEGKTNVTPKDVFQLLQPYDQIEGGVGDLKEGQELDPPLKENENPVNPDVSDASSADSCEIDSGEKENVKAGTAKPSPDKDNLSEDADGELDDKSTTLAHPMSKDLMLVDILLSVAKQLEDPALLLAVQNRREHMLRHIRRSDPVIAAGALQFVQSTHEAVSELQAAARLEDNAKTQLKAVKNAHKLWKHFHPQCIRKRKALPPPEPVSAPVPPPEKSLAVPPPAPSLLALEAPSASAVEPSTAPEPDPPLPPPALPPPPSPADVALAVVAAPEKLGEAKHSKKDKKHKDKKKKHTKPKAAIAAVKIKKAKIKPVPKDEILFPISLETELKLRSVLARLAAEWEHVHKAPLLDWLARDIHKDFRTCAKVHPCISKYLKRVPKPLELTKGAGAKVLLDKVKDMSIPDRAKWFERCYDAMLAEVKKMTASSKNPHLASLAHIRFVRRAHKTTLGQDILPEVHCQDSGRTCVRTAYLYNFAHAPI